MEYLKEIVQKNSKRHQKLNKKRHRSAFTTDQINFLENEFQKCAYIDVESRKELANIVKIPERAIKIWFQNRRMKEKKCTEKESDGKQSNTFVNDPLINLSNIKLVNDLHYRDLQMSRISPNCNLQELLSHTRNNFNSDREKRNDSSTMLVNMETDNIPKHKKYIAEHLSKRFDNYNNSVNNYDNKSNIKQKYDSKVTLNNFYSSDHIKESLLSTKRKLHDSHGVQGPRQNKRRYIKQDSNISGDLISNANSKHCDPLSYRDRDTLSHKVNIEDIKKPISSFDTGVKNSINIKKLNANCNCICNCCRLRSHCESSEFHIPYMLIVPTCSLGKNNN